MKLKEIYWVGNSREELCSFPRAVRRDIGYALHFAQAGDKHATAKVLRRFGGASVLEVIENSENGTYRVVYTVRFPRRIYVLLAFQKKSTRGIKTPTHILKLLEARLRDAREHFLGDR